MALNFDRHTSSCRHLFTGILTITYLVVTVIAQNINKKKRKQM